MHDGAAAIARQDFVGSGSGAADDRQSAPQIVVDARAHRQLGFQRLRKREQRQSEPLEKLTAAFVLEPRFESDELQAALLRMLHCLGYFSLWRQFLIGM